MNIDLVLNDIQQLNIIHLIDIPQCGTLTTTTMWYFDYDHNVVL